MTAIIIDFNQGKVFVDRLVTTSSRHECPKCPVGLYHVEYKDSADIFPKVFQIKGGICDPVKGGDTDYSLQKGILVGCGNSDSLKNLADNFGKEISYGVAGESWAYAIYKKGGSYNMVSYEVIDKQVKETRKLFCFDYEKTVKKGVWKPVHESVHQEGYLCYGSGAESCYNGLIKGMSPKEAIQYAASQDIGVGETVIEVDI